MSARLAEEEKGSLSIRLPNRLKYHAAEVAQSQQISFNTFVTRLIEKAVKATEDQELYTHFPN